jgi:hypothetical protein
MAAKNSFVDSLGRNATPLLLLAGGAIAYFKIIKPIIDKVSDPFGKGEQHKDDVKNVEQLKTEGYFDPGYKNDLKQNNVILSLTPYGQKLYAEKIYNAKGIPYLTNDNEGAVYGVFRALNSKTQISYLAEYFINRYNKDLKAYLQSFLNQNEFGNVATICNKLPIGITDNNGKILK